MPDEEKLNQSEPDPPVLIFMGDPDSGEPHIPGVPARDLTAHDISRLVYRGVMTPEHRFLTPDDKGFEKAAAHVGEVLLARYIPGTSDPLYAAATAQGKPKSTTDKGRKAAAQKVGDAAADVPPAPEPEPTVVVAPPEV
jgi:hypothetical protein